jgi:hypothetical protein
MSFIDQRLELGRMARWVSETLLEVRAMRRALALKYRPDQPRVPARSGRESGRWTDSEVGVEDSSLDLDGDGVRAWLAQSSGETALERACWEQREREFNLCARAGPAPRVLTCRGVASTRYAECLQGEVRSPLPSDLFTPPRTGSPGRTRR